MGVPDRAEATVTSKDAALLLIHTQAGRRPSFSIYHLPHPTATLGNLPSQLPPLSVSPHTHPHHFCRPAKTPTHTLPARSLTHTLTHSSSHPYHCLAVQHQFCSLWRIALQSCQIPGTCNISLNTHSHPLQHLTRSPYSQDIHALTPQTAFQTHPCPSLFSAPPSSLLLPSDN